MRNIIRSLRIIEKFLLFLVFYFSSPLFLHTSQFVNGISRYRYAVGLNAVIIALRSIQHVSNIR